MTVDAVSRPQAQVLRQRNVPAEPRTRITQDDD